MRFDEALIVPKDHCQNLLRSLRIIGSTKGAYKSHAVGVDFLYHDLVESVVGWLADQGYEEPGDDGNEP